MKSSVMQVEVSRKAIIAELAAYMQAEISWCDMYAQQIKDMQWPKLAVWKESMEPKVQHALTGQEKSLRMIARHRAFCIPPEGCSRRGDAITESTWLRLTKPFQCRITIALDPKHRPIAFSMEDIPAWQACRDQVIKRISSSREDLLRKVSGWLEKAKMEDDTIVSELEKTVNNIGVVVEVC